MMLHEMLKALVAKGHRAQVHLSRRSRAANVPYELDGVEIYPRSNSKQDVAWLEPAAKADVLITHLDNTPQVVAAAITRDKPLVQILHNTHPTTRTWATCKADLLVANSEWMADAFDRPEKMVVVRPPVHQADYAVPLNPKGAITLVNLNQAKGGLLFAQLAALMPYRQFVGVKGAYGEQLTTTLPNVRIYEHAEIPISQIYRQSALVLMPSSYESWGRVGIEAMCSGIPVLAHPTPGLKESLGRAGVFADRDDLHLWRRIINNILGQPAIYKALSARSLERAKELDPHADLNRWVEAVEALA